MSSREFPTSAEETLLISSAAPRVQTAKWRSDVQALLQSPSRLHELDGVLPPPYSGERSFDIPEYAFIPDQWTRALLKGLSNPELELEGRNVLELGLGTGACAAFVLATRNPKRLYGSDVDGRLSSLALQNVARNTPGNLQRFFPIPGDQDLARWIKKAGVIDVAYGCLPQVVIPKDLDLAKADNRAHYYDPKKYPSELHHLGLGLNDCALREMKSLLPDGGSMVLNLSGRPGREEVLENNLFRANGYEPHLLHEELIQQHAETSLARLSEVEGTSGFRFEFFRDADGNSSSQITASDAEELRLKGEPIYHKIYVIEGRKVPSN